MYAQIETIYTHHALKRMSQRGITQNDVDRVIQYGRCQYTTKGQVFVIGKREIRRLKGLVKGIENLEGIHVLVGLDFVVITTYRNREDLFKSW